MLSHVKMAVQQEYTLVWFLVTLVHFNNGQPQGVEFIPQNFHSILHWKPPNKTESNTRYFVEYRRYYSKKWKKTECWDINNTLCDLTQETLPINECYSARVSVDIGVWAKSVPFCPSIQTVIPPPEIELTPREKSILVRINHGLTNAPKKLDYEEHPGIQYRITVSSKAQGQILLERSKTTNNRTFEIQQLSPGKIYCLSVETKINDYISHPSMQQCTTLAEQHREAILSITLCLAVGIVLIIILPLSLYFLYKNIYHPKAHLPPVLSGWNSTAKNYVFLPRFIEQTNINEWKYITDLKELSSTFLLQNRYVPQAHCKKYINIESHQITALEPYHNSVPLDGMFFQECLEQPQFVCPDYAQMTIDPISLLYSNQRVDIQKLESVPIEHSQCHAEYQNQGQEILDWKEVSLGQVIESESPQYINQVIVDDPFLNHWGLCLHDE